MTTDLQYVQVVVMKGNTFWNTKCAVTSLLCSSECECRRSKWTIRNIILFVWNGLSVLSDLCVSLRLSVLTFHAQWQFIAFSVQMTAGVGVTKWINVNFHSYLVYQITKPITQRQVLNLKPHSEFFQFRCPGSVGLLITHSTLLDLSNRTKNKKVQMNKRLILV